ncbi:hypothetical protein D3C87_1835230 [compost metagenome]
MRSNSNAPMIGLRNPAAKPLSTKAGTMTGKGAPSASVIKGTGPAQTKPIV